MEDNPEQQLTEKIKHCQETARNLEEEKKRLRFILKMQPDTVGDSDDSVKQTPLVDDVTKRLMDIDLALESNQQQVKLALKQYLHTQSALHSSQDRSAIQSDANHMQGSNVKINQQIVLSDNNNGQIEVKLNTAAPEPHALFNRTLPDDFYLHLMSVIGLQDCLLSNRLVCSFWNELVLERCHNQKSLKLFGTFANLMDYGELLLQFEKTDDPSLILKSIGDDLIFEGLETDHLQLVNHLNLKSSVILQKKQEASQVLTTKFPRVEQLVLCTEWKTFIDVKQLLQFYAKQLASLTMTYFAGSQEPSCLLRTFRFPCLKSLNTLNFSPKEDQLFTLLPQLESLTMGRTYFYSLETLLRTGTQLQELNLQYIQSVYTRPVGDFAKRPPMISNLLKLSFGLFQYESNIFEFISQNLTSLESLKMDLRFIRKDGVHLLHSVISYLAPLTQLHSLTLQTPVSFFLLNENQLAEIQPLPSVRHLKLILSRNGPLSMDLFSNALFAAFPKIEQVLIAFIGNDDEDRVDSVTFASFEDFACNHPNLVQLFRTKKMFKFTSLPNAVSPLLGHHRQMYDEFIQVEELVGVPTRKLANCLVSQERGDLYNLKIALRPADRSRFAALSNLLQLLEHKAFTFSKSWDTANRMMLYLLDSARKYGPSEAALFILTCKCVLSLLSFKEFLNYHSSTWSDMVLFEFFEKMLQMKEHYQRQPFKDEELLLQIHNFMNTLIKEMLQLRNLPEVVSELIRSSNRVHRIEAVHALLRVCNSTKNCFRSD